MLAIQFIAPAELRPTQPCRANWNDIHPLAGVDYSSYSSVATRTALLQNAADDILCYRIVEVASAPRALTAEERAYLLLERLATGEASDEELDHLMALADELDRSSVPYRGWR